MCSYTPPICNAKREAIDNNTGVRAKCVCTVLTNKIFLCHPYTFALGCNFLCHRVCSFGGLAYKYN